MPRPRIGFTSREQDIDYFLTWQRDYWFAIELAGGEPVRLVPEEVQDFDAALADLDGLLLTGGGDMDPAYYGEAISGTDPASIYPGTRPPGGGIDSGSSRQGFTHPRHLPRLSGAECRPGRQPRPTHRRPYRQGQ